MLDTGFPRADAENDFVRARRHQALAALTHRLRHQPADSDRLLTLDEAVGKLGWRGQRHLGLQTVPLNKIVGTAGSRRDFDRHFRPTTGRVRERWEQLALAERRGAAIPPIEVYRVDGLHFVSDGHHPGIDSRRDRPADDRRLRDRDTHRRAARGTTRPRPARLRPSRGLTGSGSAGPAGFDASAEAVVHVLGIRMMGGCLCLGAGDGFSNGVGVSVFPAAVLDDALDAPALRGSEHVVGIGAAQQVELAVA